MSCDILFLSWSSARARDTEASVLVYNYIKMQGPKVAWGAIHDGFWLILKHRPHVVFLECIFGARVNVDVAVFAKSLGCKVVSLIGEGAFAEQFYDKSMIWGWNTEHEAFWDALFMWNNQYFQFFSDMYPEAARNVHVIGSTGHDRYTVVPHSSSLREQKANFDFTVGVGCWIFFLDSNESFYTSSTANVHTLIQEERQKFDDTLAQIIENNKHILFILKEHPGNCDGPRGSGIEKSLKLPNVLIPHKSTPISECLAASDIWMSYESTTALEAWLMGIPTALLNPLGTDLPFKRAPFYQGQPNFATAEEWTDALQTFQKEGFVPGFSELAEERKRIIRQIITHSDGLNHVRVGNKILNLLQKSSRSTPQLPDFQLCKNAVNNTLRWHFGHLHQYMPSSIPWFAEFKNFYNNYKKNFVENDFYIFSESRKVEQRKFYTKLALTKRGLRRI